MRISGSPPHQPKKIEAAQKSLDSYPKSPDAAKLAWNAAKASNAGRAGPPLAHGEAFPGKDEAARDVSRRNFLCADLLPDDRDGCLAAYPDALLHHAICKERRAPRYSWSLFFIFPFYFTAPALAVLVKYDVSHIAGGIRIRQIASLVTAWQSVDKSLLSVVDVNKDGIVQLAEIVIGGDIVVLATPEIVGLPHVISGLVAAGGSRAFDGRQVALDDRQCAVA